MRNIFILIFFFFLLKFLLTEEVLEMGQSRKDSFQNSKILLSSIK